MNMDYMSQFMGPGLGGIMAGTEQRQLEDKRHADTQMTLQQILASQGQEQERAALLPGKLAQESDRAALAPLVRQETQGRINAADAKARADDMNGYIDAQIKMGDMPGGQESILQDPRFTKFQNHPISKKAQEILIQGKTDPEGAKKAWAEMREQISTTAATIEKRQQEEAAAKKAREALESKEGIEARRIQAQRDMLVLKGQMNREIQELKNEAAQAKTSAQKESVSQVVGAAMRRMDEAELSGDPEQMKAARRFLDQAKGVAKEINAAVTTEKGQNAVLRARALGINVPDYAPVAAPQATPPAATPTPAATQPGPRVSPSGRGVTVGPTSQAPAPQGGPGPVAQAADAVAAAVLPSAQAAQPTQAQQIEQPMWAEAPPPQQPQGSGMVQPVNMQRPPAYRQPQNVNFAATDIPKQGGRTQVLMDEVRNTQMKIASLNQRLQVAQRNGDKEYISMLAEDLEREQKNLPLIMREIESLRGK